MLDRCYSLLEIKAIDEDKRIIEGIATTPSTDRVGDVIEPEGAVFKLPLPFMWQHGKDPFVGPTPVGNLISAKITKNGIPVRIQMERSDQPGRLKDILDFAWEAVKKRLVRGLSIGFNPLEATDIKGSFGQRFTKWDWLELSAVTIGANADASIVTLKDISAASRAASGEVSEPVVRPSAGVSAIRAKAQTSNTMKTTAEQISAFEATRAAKSARMTEIMQKAGDEGVTLDTEQETEYDGLETEVKSIDNHLTRLAALEKSNAAAAVPVSGSNPKAASDARGGTNVVSVKSNLPPGTGFTRYAMALAASRGSRLEAIEYAKRWEKDTPEVGLVLKAAMAAGTTTDADWAAPLVVYQNLTNEFVELLRPATIIGRIAGLRRVPFNVTMPNQTQGATVGWVGQTKAKPVSELKFTQLSLGMAKAAGIVVLSEELVRSSSPSAEAIVRQDLIATIAAFLDVQFIDPSVAAVTNVSPAAITNGITATDSTGVTAAAFRTDFKTMVAAQIAAGISSLSGAHLIMTETQALAFSLMQNALGQSEFPGMTMNGGTLLGLPVVASEAVPAEGGSPAGSRIVLVLPREIFVADDGGVTLDVSREASIQMNSTPDDPATASTVYVNFWQNNLVGLKAERFINWLRRRDAAVGIIEGAVYTG